MDEAVLELSLLDAAVPEVAPVEPAAAVSVESLEDAAEEPPCSPVPVPPLPLEAPGPAAGVTSSLWRFSSLSETGRGGVGAWRLVTVVAVPAVRVTPWEGWARLAVCTTPWITATPVMLAWW